MDSYTIKDLKELELEIWEQEEKLRELKKKKSLIEGSIICNHLYVKNGYSCSEVINNRIESVEIIKCTKCGHTSKMKEQVIKYEKRYLHCGELSE